MDQVNHRGLTVDRIIEIPTRAEGIIRQSGFGWFLDGENVDYVSSDAICLEKKEADELLKASGACYEMVMAAFKHVDDNNLWKELGLPDSVVPLIKHDWKRELPHICGRFDFAGGVKGLPVKLIEFNADTCTSMPESVYFQAWLKNTLDKRYKNQVNGLLKEMTNVFRLLKQRFSDRAPSLLLTALGHIEDELNLKVIGEAAQNAGFSVDYAPLEEVVFSEDGVFLESEEGYTEYNFIYKLVPWEFVIFEEPDLLDILKDLCINADLIVLNPAYSIAFQSKHLLSIMYNLFPDSEYLLPTYNEASPLSATKYVEKVAFGRLGENINIFDASGNQVAENGGDFGDFTKIYQAFAEMHKDDDGDIYQPSVYINNGASSCISFRRRDGLIIDDDAEFVTHVVT